MSLKEAKEMHNMTVKKSRKRRLLNTTEPARLPGLVHLLYTGPQRPNNHLIRHDDFRFLVSKIPSKMGFSILLSVK